MAQGGELGCADAYYYVADSIYNGEGVEMDKKKQNITLSLQLWEDMHKQGTILAVLRMMQATWIER